jgi:transposase-like protein
MAKREKFQQTVEERRNRYFSESFKRQKVKDIENRLCTVLEISREYEVSCVAIYAWVKKYSIKMKKGTRKVIETESDTRKLQLLKSQVRELERIIGQKQIELDFKDKMIELAEVEYKIDIKKKLSSKLLSGTGLNEKGASAK